MKFLLALLNVLKYGAIAGAVGLGVGLFAPALPILATAGTFAMYGAGARAAWVGIAAIRGGLSVDSSVKQGEKNPNVGQGGANNDSDNDIKSELKNSPDDGPKEDEPKSSNSSAPDKKSIEEIVNEAMPVKKSSRLVNILNGAEKIKSTEERIKERDALDAMLPKTPLDSIPTEVLASHPSFNKDGIDDTATSDAPKGLNAPNNITSDVFAGVVSGESKIDLENDWKIKKELKDGGKVYGPNDEGTGVSVIVYPEGSPKSNRIIQADKSVVLTEKNFIGGNLSGVATASGLALKVGAIEENASPNISKTSKAERSPGQETKAKRKEIVKKVSM